MVLRTVIWSSVILGFLGVLAISIRRMTYWRSRGVPSANTFPILGMLGELMVRRKSLVQAMTETYNAFPGARYFGDVDFGGYILVIKDPEIVKDICVKNFANFQNHRDFVDENFDPILGRNLFTLKDERWRSMRTSLSPSFTANKMKYMFELVSKCSLDFVEYLKRDLAPTEDTDLRDAYTRYTNDVIATSAFGISVNSLKDRDNDFYVNGKDATNTETLSHFVKMVMSRWFPRSMRLAGLSFLSRKTNEFFKRLIRDTVRERDEKGIARPDMIHLLMRARDNGSGEKIDVDDITAQAVLFFLAGFDAASRLLCFVSHLLAHHPEVQERLRDEVDAIFAEERGEGELTYETLASTRYMDMVIAETLRLYPPTPFVDRVCGESHRLPPPTEDSGPFTLRPNDVVWIPVFAYHRDPDYFPDPENFDPERFSEENRRNVKPYTYLPFGVGPRKCIAERFALMEAKLLVARLLRNFVLVPSKKTKKVITFAKGAFMMNPEGGFFVKFEPRKTE